MLPSTRCYSEFLEVCAVRGNSEVKVWTHVTIKDVIEDSNLNINTNEE